MPPLLVVLCSLAWVLIPVTGRAQTEAVRLPQVDVQARHVFRPPTYQHTPLPSYPPAALAQGQEGAGLFEVHVTKEGRVAEVRVKQTTRVPVLDEAAQQTIKTWTFEPGRRGPDPVESWVDVPVRFTLKAR